jgi:hypothetical protein
MPYDYTWPGWYFKGNADPRSAPYLFEIVGKNGRRPVVGFILYPRKKRKKRK